MQRYLSFTHFTVLRCTRTRILRLHQSFPSNGSQHKLPQSHTANITHKSSLHRIILHNSRREVTWTAEFSLPLLYSLTQLTTAHTKSSSTTNLTWLPPTENSLKTNFSLSYEPWIWHAENRSVLYSCWRHALRVCDVTAERDHVTPSLLLRDLSVYSCRLATGNVSTSAPRSDVHRLLCCCIIAVLRAALLMNSLSNSVTILTHDSSCFLFVFIYILFIYTLSSWEYDVEL
jgi:hypothetical protein